VRLYRHRNQVKNPGDYFRTLSDAAGRPGARRRGEIRVIQSVPTAGRLSSPTKRHTLNSSAATTADYHLDAPEAVPLQHGYPQDFDRKIRNAMVQLARVKSYRGFVFASEPPTATSKIPRLYDDVA